MNHEDLTQVQTICTRILEYGLTKKVIKREKQQIGYKTYIQGLRGDRLLITQENSNEDVDAIILTRDEREHLLEAFGCFGCSEAVG